MLSENMASLGGEQIISTKDLSDPTIQKDKESRPSSVEKKALMEDSNSTIHWFAQIGDDRDSIQASRDREEKLRLAKERQNEERQRKIDELRAQAEAAQKYREQKEEERRRRIEDLRSRDNDRRQQVEERKRAIIEAEKERREYILKKNQEREARLDTKRRNDKGSIVFAFGSSTPRLLDPAELGNVSPSSYWGHRRSTSITNVAYTGAPLTRRSSERELTDGPKKRATSAGGIDRSNDDRRHMSTSMYEVFNWGHSSNERPQRFSLSIAGAEIDIDGPPPTNAKCSKVTKEESTDSPAVSYRSVARRKTDLMPTIPSPRESSFGSRTSLYSHTPRTPGRAVSMTRLDQLAQPIRRNGEHIRAVIERERQLQYGLLISPSTTPNTLTQTSPTTTDKSFTSSTSNRKSMSRSMTHLAGNKSAQKQNANDIGSIIRPLRKKDTFRSMSQLTTANRSAATTTTTTAATATATKKAAGRSKYERKRDDAPSSLTSTGSRSGDVTPGGSINTSRPGSAMSTSTTASGLVQRRSTPQTRKPRPASIAVTGVTLIDDLNKQKKEKPPLPRIQSTPKRNNVSSAPNSISRGQSLESNSAIKQTERRQPVKKDQVAQKPKALFQTGGDTMSKSMTASMKILSEKIEQTKEVKEIIATDHLQTKEEKEAINSEKCEVNSTSQVPNASEVMDVIDEQKLENIENIEIDKIDEKTDDDTEKEIKKSNDTGNEKPRGKDKLKEKETAKENSVEPRELSVERQQDNEMTASMMARKITTEEEAKAALAERRRLAREEAERQAELERQRVEAERQVELRRQAEEEEKQRLFEEETLRMAEEQRKAEDERLLQAIVEAKKREEAEKVKREEEEKAKVEREEAEKKAKEEAEKQRLEIAERLKREEKEREERRKRVEAIMSRTRTKGGNSTPNSTPTKDNENNKTEEKEFKNVESHKPIDDNIANNKELINQNNENVENINNSEQIEMVVQIEEQPKIIEQNTYEQSVTEKENALMKSFSNMIVDEHAKIPVYQNFQNPLGQVTNGKIIDQQQLENKEILLHPISNGNGHSENLNKDATNNDLVDFSSATITDQLIDFTIESQQIADAVNFNNNNNNNLLTTSSTQLVTSDSHENKEISLL